MTPQHNKILKYALQFRAAIDNALEANEVNSRAFRNFPIGCCDDASDLLAQYLLELGIRTNNVCGTFYSDSGEQQSHAWLCLDDNTYLDITGDQFKFHKEPLCFSTPVYLGPPTPFHDLFHIERVSPENGIDSFGEPAKSNLKQLYRTICLYL